MYLRPEKWISALRSEYLDHYIRMGGSAFKMVCCMEDVDPEEIGLRVSASAVAGQYITVSLDAAQCKLHMIEQIFHFVARSVDWESLTRSVIEIWLSENGYCLPERGAEFTIRSIALLNNREERELRRDIKRWIEQGLYKDREMALEFRIAMTRLCLAMLEKSYDDQQRDTCELILSWLQGEIRLISRLKDELIFSKINRHNARNMLKSLAYFIHLTGHNGLCLHLDFARYYILTKPAEPDGSYYYSKPATMDLYEVMRQFIDGTDQTKYLLIVAVSGSEALTSDRRSIENYMALRDRLLDDVHDKNRANPMASLVRLAHCGDASEIIVSSSYDQVNRLAALGAIEALRSGVPNQFAVKALGIEQPSILDRFNLQLSKLIESPASQSPGMLIAAGFGGGKSHLLEFFEHKVLEENFICSRIVISKETPLFDPGKLFQSAIAGMRLPKNHCSGLSEIALRLDPSSSRCDAFNQWLLDAQPPISDRFAASYWVYTHLRAEPAMMDQMERFWSGDKLTDGALKKILRSYRQGQSFRFEKTSKEDLAFQRFRFASQLILAAGFSGWVILVDEAELIGRYSLMQRARSYGMMARLLGRVEDCQFEGLTSVIAITDDFPSAVIDEKNDIQGIPQRLTANGSESANYLSQIAKITMQIIQKDRILLRQPSDGSLETSYNRIRTLHSTAYNWDAPDVGYIERLSSSRMREYIKSWITQWDLKRFDPEYTVNLTLDERIADYSQDSMLEEPMEQIDETN